MLTGLSGYWPWMLCCIAVFYFQNELWQGNSISTLCPGASRHQAINFIAVSAVSNGTTLSWIAFLLCQTLAKLVLSDHGSCSNFIIKVFGRLFIFHRPAQISNWKFITTEKHFKLFHPNRKSFSVKLTRRQQREGQIVKVIHLSELQLWHKLQTTEAKNSLS